VPTDLSSTPSAAPRPDDVVFQVVGVFDDLAARRLEDALAQARPGARVRLDLSRARELQDHGLALVARALGGRAGAVRVALLGLRRHQVRLLRYLGVDVTAAPVNQGAS
jgi:hypothetical protein